MHNPHESKTDLGAPLDGAVMVLLVDDQAMIGEAVRRSLASEAGIDFHFCSDPQQAVAVANQIKPTVILQDLVMPGVDGLTLLAAYRGNPATRDIPIIVLSTKEEPTVKSAAFAAGANDYLVKLPDAIELVARIRYHSRSYIALQQRDEAYRALRESQQQLLETNLVLQRLMNSDGLTGLSNRRHFDEYLEMEWRRSLREQSQLSLLMIDVDYFKSYNDTFGHVAGDEALRQVAGAIREGCSRSSDLAARYGGEEFAHGPAGHLAGRRAAAGGKGPAYGGEPADQPRPATPGLVPDRQHRRQHPGAGRRRTDLPGSHRDGRPGALPGQEQWPQPGWPDGTTGAAGPGGLSGARRPCVAGRH
ncbi:Phytochrome-like protein cph2 [Pseudomonas aeruginosa]|uniref:diguanylate cyclase n=1 Tax=Pseudomonas aeruginosa TaxID=287 RepID=A0A9P1R4V7_PSEAI|nr:response regulator [Pseudomonas aeruginosa]CDH69652.1 two-component response regulator [Pseudomonas aeruginosa MH38]CDI92127.1 putative two-component response regulator [Pseudomonas aeruginosa PA38182]AXL75541.1 Two-component response regulator [Pseudomonas aeruginosa]QGH89732.1 Chemotaxis response regulator protein-glutamate methylesterase [Pseudomonas aeruginosa]